MIGETIYRRKEDNVTEREGEKEVVDRYRGRKKARKGRRKN